MPSKWLFVLDPREVASETQGFYKEKKWYTTIPDPVGT
jgi:hypothetical protein